MAKGGTIVVSLRSRGLPSFNKALLFDIRYQAVQLTTEFLDIFIAAVVSFACLSWSSWISVAITAVSIGATRSTKLSIPADAVFVFFIYIILPLLILLLFVFNRRDQALRSLADFKAAFVSLTLHRPFGASQQQRDASDELHQKAAVFIDDLRQYLQHRRPYVRHFFLPYRTSSPSPTDQLLKVSRELGLLLRRVHRGVRDMHMACERLREAGISDSQVHVLVGRVEAVHSAMERLMNIKEMRTPVVLRATIRWFVVVMIPITMGPFWNHFPHSEVPGAMSGILGVLTQIALVGIMDTVVAMEDPFDDTALDAVSLFEMIDQVGVMTTPADESDGYDTGGLGASNAAPVGAAGGGGGGGGLMEANAHVAMYVSGIPEAVPAPEAEDVDPTAGPAGPAAGGQMSSPGPGSVVASVGGPAPPRGTSGGGGGSAAQAGRQQPSATGLVQPIGAPAMYGSIVTSETAVGPPSAIEPYGVGTTALQSITSPALPEMAYTVRSPAPMPPMPALAGQQMGVRTGAMVF